MIRFATSVMLSIVLVCVVGCVGNQWLIVESGEYVAIKGIGKGSSAAVRLLRGAEVDRQAGTLVIEFADGQERTLDLVPRERERWPSGCPTNLYSTRMEVLEVEGSALVLGPLTIEDPVLVRDCPDEPVALVLRADGSIGGGGSACSGAGECIRFEPLDGGNVDRLPSSMKGYELYSWRGEDGWWFTLITGTNRNKTWEEIADPVGEVTEDGWVKLTVQGTDALRDTLRRLPQGEQVSWIGPDGFVPMGENVASASHELVLPEEEVLADLGAYCARLGIEMITVR